MIKRLIRAREFALLLVLVAMMAVFSATVDGFLDWFNIFDQTRYWAIAGIIAVPMTFIIATAGIDLSVASIVALSTVTIGMLFESAGMPIWVAVAGGLGVGLLAGSFNGFFASYVGVPPLVVTLGTIALFRGLAMGVSRAQPMGGFPDGYTALGMGDAFSFPLGGETVYVPIPLMVMLAVFAAGTLIFRRTALGRYTEAIGENEVAAAFAAIDVRWVKLLLYAGCGACCGLAAVVNTALNATAKADTATGLELEVIACVVVGGTRISGGQGSVVGTLLGLFILGILRYGLEMQGVRTQHIIIVVGAILIATAVFNEWMAAKRGE